MRRQFVFLSLLITAFAYCQDNIVDKSFLGINSQDKLSGYTIKGEKNVYPLDFFLESWKQVYKRKNNEDFQILTYSDFENKTEDLNKQGILNNNKLEKKLPSDFAVKYVLIGKGKGIFYNRKITFDKNGDLSSIELIGQTEFKKETVLEIKNGLIQFYGNDYKEIENEKDKSILLVWSGNVFRLYYQFKLVENNIIEISIVYARI